MSRLTAAQDTLVESEVYHAVTLVELLEPGIAGLRYTTAPYNISATTDSGTYTWVSTTFIVQIDSVNDTDFFSNIKSAIVVEADSTPFNGDQVISIYKLFINTSTGLAATDAIPIFSGKVKNTRYTFSQTNKPRFQHELIGEVFKDGLVGVPNASIGGL